MKQFFFFSAFLLLIMFVGCSSDEVKSNTEFFYKEIDINGIVWMDRNLGANGPKELGWLFQWGRPADGHQLLESETTIKLSETTIPDHGMFILAAGGHWVKDQPLDYYKLTNVCPEGWRLPTPDEFNSLIQVSEYIDRRLVYKNKDQVFMLPAIGYRDDETGVLVERDKKTQKLVTFYPTMVTWNSSIYGLELGFIYGDTTVAITYNGSPSDGYPVRCVKGWWK